MASYSPKLLEKKYNNWVKAQLAVLITKEGIEPFVCNEIQQFQLKCLNDIRYNNGLLSGTLCSSCCTENVVRCPTARICNVRGGKCSYHRNGSTQYLPNGCPNKICHHFNTEIKNVHRYCGPSYKNTDATQWCSNYWKVATCFMPPDGYKDVTSAADTDFNGIIAVIINCNIFQLRVYEHLSSRGNIFEQARAIGRNVRHSSSLEVEDTHLQQYFSVLKTLLSDPGYLATDKHAQIAKQKLFDLENDILVVGKDDITKALNDVAKAAQDKIRTEIDEQKKQHDMIKFDMIKRKVEDFKDLDSKSKKIKEELTSLAESLQEDLYTRNIESKKQNIDQRNNHGHCSESLAQGLGESKEPSNTITRPSTNSCDITDQGIAPITVQQPSLENQNTTNNNSSTFSGSTFNQLDNSETVVNNITLPFVGQQPFNFNISGGSNSFHFNYTSN